MSPLDGLVALSRRFGSDPEWVLAGGGNTSLKLGGALYIKASGTSLGTIDESGFCAIDRSKLDAMWSASYPEEADAREAAALADLMAARMPGEAKRPSVETLMHGLFPQAYVVHTHPAAVNGVTCGKEGRAAFERLFAGEGIWVPFVDPGYVLAKTVRAALEEFRARVGKVPSIMLMQNHGFLVAADSPAEVEDLSERAMAAVLGEVKRRPDMAARAVDAQLMAEAAATILMLAEGSEATPNAAAGHRALSAPRFRPVLRFRADGESLERASSRETFEPLSSAFTPDHIVYAGHQFLLADGVEGIEGAWSDFVARNGQAPRIIVVKGLGAFSCVANPGAADAAMLLYTDACKVAAYAESFGGALHMTKERIDFIRNWEVEKYRSQSLRL